MKNIFYLGLLSISVVLFSCKDSGAKKTTSTGYEYDVHLAGDGKSPKPGEFVFFEMQIKKHDGTVLQDMKNVDNKPVIQIPFEKVPVQRPNPIIDLLSDVTEGDSIHLYIPRDSIPNPPAEIEGETGVVYDIVVIEVVTEDEFKARQEDQQKRMEEEKERLKGLGEEKGIFVADILNRYKSGQLDEILIKHESGLEYVIHNSGGGKKAEQGQNITAHYYGVFKNTGEMFDNSYRAGRPFSFPLGKRSVIQGWDIGFAEIRPGTDATFFVPSDLAYGQSGRGSIGPGEDLVFYVEFLSAK